MNPLAESGRIAAIGAVRKMFIHDAEMRTALLQDAQAVIQRNLRATQ